MVNFEFYVMNYDFNHKKIYPYNIFNNIKVHKHTNEEIEKYIRAPDEYESHDYTTGESIFGFDALCREVDFIIKWQEWGRVQYEISIGAPFEDDVTKLVKIDCYEQCKNNIPMIVRECIYQYKKQMEDDYNGKSK